MRSNLVDQARMMRPSQTMESMYLDMMERRSVLNRKDSLAYQFTGEDRYMVLYYNQQRDAAFAKAKLPPFGDGSVPYVMQVQ